MLTRRGFLAAVLAVPAAVRAAAVTQLPALRFGGTSVLQTPEVGALEFDPQSGTYGAIVRSTEPWPTKQIYARITITPEVLAESRHSSGAFVEAYRKEWDACAAGIQRELARGAEAFL